MLVVVLGLGTVGCAPGAAAPMTTPTSSAATKPPTTTSGTTAIMITPTEQPVASGPSDRITGLWVLGTVTRGGSGPCYGLTTDDGRQLALSGKTLGPLTNGDRIRVLVQASERPIDCGPGEQFSATEVKRAG